MTIIKRSLSLPEKSFFLFGPRATGKSTWLKEVLPNALRFDLLKASTYLELLKNPLLLREIIDAHAPEWIIIDEIQKLPGILDEVHSIIFDYNGQIKFALTGSSARKLKRENANLLAGRALTRNFFPLTLEELGNPKNIETLLHFGSLPEITKLSAHEEKIDYLSAYVETYLKEEIQQETKVRDLSSFTRFLSVAAILNGQILNLSNIARDCALARSTVQGHFSILIDTLLGSLIMPYRPKIKVKEIASPKFYFFDPGVVNALKGNLSSALESTERGFLLETFFLNELKAANSYHRHNGEIYFWRTADGNEVDFIFKKGKKIIGFEIKSSKEWKKSYTYGLETLLTEKIIHKAYGIYLGERELLVGNVEVKSIYHLNLNDLIANS